MQEIDTQKAEPACYCVLMCSIIHGLRTRARVCVRVCLGDSMKVVPGS